MSKKPRVVIVMPTYNEKKNISWMLGELIEKQIPQIKNADIHLLVVDGNSPDGTGDVVKKFSKKHKNVHLMTETEKRGLGMAYVDGFKYAMEKLDADAVMEMDADGQHPPDHVARMVDAFVSGADYVIGARYIPGGSIPKEWGLFRKAVSYFGNLFIRIVLTKFSLHDLTTGFRLTRVKGVLDKIDLDTLMEPRRFAYKVDLLYRSVKQAKKVVEVPLQFRPRTKEVSKFDTKEMVATFKVAIILGIKDKARFLKFATVGFIGFVVNAVGIEAFRALPVSQSLADASSNLVNVPGLKVMTEPASWAAAMGAELAIISNFTLNNIWTFKEKKITNVGKLLVKFFQFNLTSLGAVVIQFIAIGAAVLTFGDTALVRQLALVFSVVFIIVPYNYVIYNLFIWKTWGKKEKRAKRS